MRRIIVAAAVMAFGLIAFADTNAKRLNAYDFSAVRSDVTAGRSVFYDISYTPHRSISPIHVYAIARSELSFTEDQLAAMFEYLSKNNSFLYHNSDVLAPLGLADERFSVISIRAGGSNNFVFISEK